MKRFSSYFLLLSVVSLMLASCANRGTPSGGPKDETPPVIMRSIPENYTVNFDSQEIRIYFDEYIKIKDLQKHLIISPPMKTTPEITPIGSSSKYITIKIKDTLKPNTTYAFNFGESIVDNNEGNAYPYYKYVFSTGTYIDSLKLKGSIKDAAKFKTDDFVSVGLYEIDSTFTDSIIFKEKPKYITSTLDSTVFELQNLRAGKYMLVALKEENTDYIFQPKLDKIGFLKAPITIPTEEETPIVLMFNEVPIFKVIRPTHLATQKIAFGYQGDPKGLEIEMLNASADHQFKTLKDPKTDSIQYYFKPKLEVDSLRFVTRKQDYIDTFTVRMKTLKADSLQFSTYPSRGLKFNEDFEIGANIPLVNLDASKVTLIDKDSVPVAFTTSYNKENNRYTFAFDKTEDNRYNLQLLPGALTDFFEKTNDTLRYQLNTKTESDYGNIRLTLKNAKYPVIIQLLNERDGKVVLTEYVETAAPIDLRYVSPGKYALRVIFDDNKNQKFDTGNYLEKRYPERISFYPKPLEIRAGWDEIIEFRITRLI